jgi:DNA recombination-dependent growth factor C
MMMNNVPKDIHKALGIMLKYKLINEAGMSAYLAKYIRRDNTPRVIQLPKPREATAALEKTLMDVVNRQGNQAFTVSEITQKVEAMVGKTTDSAVRYVLGLMVHKGKAEQIHADGRVLFGKKN